MARIREGCGSVSRGGLEREVFGMPIFGEGFLARGRRARRRRRLFLRSSEWLITT